MAKLTYLIPSSQDFFIGFPHDKKVVIALDRVQPVPWVFIVLYLLLLKILRSDLQSYGFLNDTVVADSWADED